MSVKDRYSVQDRLKARAGRTFSLTIEYRVTYFQVRFTRSPEEPPQNRNLAKLRVYVPMTQATVMLLGYPIPASTADAAE